MIHVRRAKDRGQTLLGWLDSRHTFSFADYYDPEHMGFRALRVLNEDRVEPGKGFPMHSHRDMEIISYVLEGTLEHKDSLGNGAAIRPGEIQRMSAGRGITHSEFNPSPSEEVHFLQIWITPDRQALTPSYEQRTIDASAARGKFQLVATQNGRPGMVSLHQDAAVSVATLQPRETMVHRLRDGRHSWLQLARGAVNLNGNVLSAGDGAAISFESELNVQAAGQTEMLLFELA
jgi:redox-sensitive bicupin YhaK (pirin superfamily)